MEIRRAAAGDLAALAELAELLWPGHEPEELRREFDDILNSTDATAFLAYDGGKAAGFAQCGLRRDYVEGSRTCPVGYLEGVYVRTEHRRKGVAKQLVRRCERWASSLGCSEFASDCTLENQDSLRFHLGTGFQEANRIICFVKVIEKP